MHKRAVPILKYNDQAKLIQDVEALKRVLLKENGSIGDYHPVVISIAGAFRKGKSFLLDFVLRYLYFTYKPARNPHSASWLGDENAPLKGFDWKGGSELVTTGILIWPDIFCTTLPNGEKVAIIIMDTQGNFDQKSILQDCSTVFALSTLLSSVQIYNLFHNIQEDDLQNLRLFVEYGKLALEKDPQNTHKPFQKLQFLVRDWNWPYENPYGAKGGAEKLKETLKVTREQQPELRSLRNGIKSIFSEIECFLMPDPGEEVKTNPKFNGKLSQINKLFLRYVDEFVSSLLSLKHLVSKEIDGQKITVRKFVEYFEKYATTLSGSDMPRVNTALEANVAVYNLLAIESAIKTYNELMEDVCGGSNPYITEELLEKAHDRCRRIAIEEYQEKPKWGGDEYSQQYFAKLNENIERDYKHYTSHNKSKASGIVRALLVFFRKPWTTLSLSSVIGGIAGTAIERSLMRVAVGVVFGTGVGGTLVSLGVFAAWMLKNKQKIVEMTIQKKNYIEAKFTRNAKKDETLQTSTKDAIQRYVSWWALLGTGVGGGIIATVTDITMPQAVFKTITGVWISNIIIRYWINRYKKSE